MSVSVENIEVREECRDNPHFANCKLIVKARCVREAVPALEFMLV